ncbi:dynein regulatory complex subunit 4-like [Epinephelus fuscoguttatus]|uniref:dynein regulatory complex subunit 4-like n=1 Tax=Epinephelus fuscoguttatus TaxID=293821 RepID=UPI0020D0D3ED|nr:dynein regulatory complex subunit 4-like [Epinephelus fuscoguttatus]
MPPKKKDSSKKPAKARTPVLIDGRTKEEMSKEQMEEHIVRLREELDREREERNYFQLERDKIHTFWEITDRELENFKAELKKVEKDIEEDEERHQVEIKVYKQKMKHLLCEHHNMISELKADGLVSTQVVQKEQEQLETELHKDMRAIVVNTEKLDIEDLIKEHELKHNEEIIKRRNSFEKQLAETKAKYQKKMELVQQELDIQRKNGIKEFELRWNSHNNNLIEEHNKALSDLREQSVNHMQQHLDKNDSNRKQIEEIKKITEEKENKRARALQDNESLEEHLRKVQKESADIEKRLRFYRPEKYDKESAKQKKVDVLKRDCEDLEQKFRKVQQERDELYETFTENIQKVQHKAGVKSTQLEGKVKGLTDLLEKRQAQLSSVLSASNMEQTAFDGVTHKIEEKLDSSNNTIRNLQYKKALISQAQKDLLLFYEAKQRALGVPVEELCVKKAL